MQLQTPTPADRTTTEKAAERYRQEHTQPLTKEQELRSPFTPADLLRLELLRTQMTLRTHHGTN